MRRAASYRDALFEGLTQLGEAGHEYAKTASALKTQAAQQKAASSADELNQLGITKEKESAKQVLARRQMETALEESAAARSKAMAGTPTANGHAVDFQAVKKSGQDFREADSRLWNRLHPESPVTVEQLAEKRDRDEAAQVLAAEEGTADATRKQEKHASDLATAAANRTNGRYSPVPLLGGGIGSFNTRSGQVEDTGAKGEPKLIGGKTAQEKHDEGVFKAKDKLRDAYEKTGTANAIIMLNDIAGKIGGIDGTGEIEGYGKTGLAPEFSLSQGGKDIRTSLAGLRNIVLKDRSGAAVSNQEFERLKEEIGGGLFGTDADLRSKLKRMGEIVAQHAQNIDATFQGDPDVPQQAFDQYRASGGTTGASLNLKAGPIAAPAGAAPGAGVPDRKAMAQEALNDPEATEQEKAQARRILGL